MPIATPADVRHAVWQQHHLPHNIDRYARSTDPTLRARKQAILQQMDHAPNRYRKAEMYDELHIINATLAAQHHDLIAAADAAVDQARTGVTNAALATKRDWCIGLYPEDSLRELRSTFEKLVP